MKLLTRIRGKTTDAKMRIHQPDLRQCRTTQVVKFDAGEFKTRDKKETASTGEKKKKKKHTESVAQKKGERERTPSGNKHARKKRTLGVPDVK